MIKHAWTTICSKTLIDKDTNNISMDVSEQIKILTLEEPKNQEIIVPFINLTIASLWYRGNPNKGETGEARIKYVAPSGAELASFKLELDLKSNGRLRTRAVMNQVSLRGAGWYYFVVELKVGKKWTEVSRIPHEVILEQKGQ